MIGEKIMNKMKMNLKSFLKSLDASVDNKDVASLLPNLATIVNDPEYLPHVATAETMLTECDFNNILEALNKGFDLTKEKIQELMMQSENRIFPIFMNSVTYGYALAYNLKNDEANGMTREMYKEKYDFSKRKRTNTAIQLELLLLVEMMLSDRIATFETEDSDIVYTSNIKMSVDVDKGSAMPNNASKGTIIVSSSNQVGFFEKDEENTLVSKILFLYAFLNDFYYGNPNDVYKEAFNEYYNNVDSIYSYNKLHGDISGFVNDLKAIARLYQAGKKIGVDTLHTFLQRLQIIAELLDGFSHQDINLEYDFVDSPELNIDILQEMAEKFPEKREIFTGKKSFEKGKFSEMEYLRENLKIDDQKDLVVEEKLRNATLPDFVKQLANRISKSYQMGFEVPYRQIQLTGDAGAGKSFGVMILSYILGLPYFAEVGSSDKLSDSDWFGRLQPRTKEAADADKSSDAQVVDLQQLYVDNGLFVTEADIDIVPEEVYFEIFGNEVDSSIDVTSQQFKNYLVRELKAKQYEIENKQKNLFAYNEDFVMVLTQLGQAALHGGVIDIQEIDMARDVAQVSGLYEFLNEGTFVLPDGRKLQRHKNCIVVFTNNASGPSCSPLPEAFLSRIQLKMNFDKKDEKSISQKLVNKFQIPESVANKIGKGIVFLSDMYDEYSVTDGTIGSREAEAWAMEYLISPKEGLFKNAKYSVLEKFSQDGELREKAEENLMAFLESD